MDRASRIALVAFVVVATIAAVSPIAKLDPGGAIATALGAGGAARSIHAALTAVCVGAPALAATAIARGRPRLAEGRAAIALGVAVALAMFVATLVVLPRLDVLHAIGRGSDQSACVEVPATRLAHGAWPYDRASIWSGNPCSPGLGWIAAAVPFAVARSVAAFLASGGIAFALLAPRVVGARPSATALVLVASSVAAWQTIVTGSDLLAAGWVLACATAFASHRRAWAIAAVAIGVVATARAPFLLLPVASAIALAREKSAHVARFLALSIGTALAAHVVGFAWNARSYVADGPFHVLGKALAHAAGASWAFAVASLASLAFVAALLRRAPAHDAIGERALFTGAVALFTVAAPAMSDLATHAAAGSLDVWRGASWLVFALPCFALAACAPVTPSSSRP